MSKIYINKLGVKFESFDHSDESFFESFTQHFCEVYESNNPRQITYFCDFYESYFKNQKDFLVFRELWACLHLLKGNHKDFQNPYLDAIEAVYSDIFNCEDSLVRSGFISGTHALTVALFAVLRPGDTLLAVTGKPYDTLEEVIGIRGENNGSLREFGVNYKEVPLKDNKPDYEAIRNAIDENVKAVAIQRSRGYSLRPTLSVAEIGEIAKLVHEKSNAVVMVDNCYGELVEKIEPTEVGADLMAGSLIKNAGGSIARTGGYIAGKKELVELCAYRATTPGLGKEVGATLGQSRDLFMGIFSAPHVVGEALKTAVYVSALFNLLGFDTTPETHETRHDIIQAVKLCDDKKLIAFCQGLQKGAPVDSFVTPMPWDMPGYDNKVIMAAGAFTLGSSIELSADAPLREPYSVWMQGGLNFHSSKIAVLYAAAEVMKIMEESEK